MILYLNFLSPLYFFLMRPETFPSEKNEYNIFCFLKDVFLSIKFTHLFYIPISVSTPSSSPILSPLSSAFSSIHSYSASV